MTLADEGVSRYPNAQQAAANGKTEAQRLLLMLLTAW